LLGAQGAWNPQGMHLACLCLFDSVRYLLWALTRNAVKTFEEEDGQPNYENKDDNADEALHAAILQIRQSPARPEIEGPNRCKFWQAPRAKLPQQDATRSLSGEGPNRCHKVPQTPCRPWPKITLTKPHNFSVGRGPASSYKVLQFLCRIWPELPQVFASSSLSKPANLPTQNDTLSLSAEIGSDDLISHRGAVRPTGECERADIRCRGDLRGLDHKELVMPNPAFYSA
jgi:hypothetical protein